MNSGGHQLTERCLDHWAAAVHDRRQPKGDS